MDDSLKALKAKKEGKFLKKKNSLEEKEEDIPQYFDIYQSQNKNYRKIFNPNISDDQETSEETSYKVYFRTPQEIHQKNKKKLLYDLNAALSTLKQNPQLYETSPLKKVKFQIEESSPTLKRVDKSAASSRQEEDDGFIKCPEGCGRKFTNLALKRHVKICKEVFLNKRDVFNTSQYRKLKESQELDNRRKLQELDQKMIDDRVELLRKEKEMREAKREAKKNDPNNFPFWKKQSEALRAVMKTNKTNSKKYDADFIREGLNKLKYEKCIGCGRLFNENAAERHIPKCVERSKIFKLHKKNIIV